MKTKTSHLALLVALPLSGCTSLFKAPPGYETSGALTHPETYSRKDWVEARAAQLENKGMSERDAKGQALAEAALRGR